MIKQAGIFALIAFWLLVLVAPGSVQAQSGLKILANSAEVDFPDKLRFNLEAKSDVNIADARLQYTVERESFARVTSEVSTELVPDNTIAVSWTWDMRKTGGLPPGANLAYWWIVTDATGNKLETAPVSIRFDDKRYSWQSLTRSKVTLYWYEGNESLAEKLMLAAEQALMRLAEETGAELKKPVKIYIYADPSDLQGAMIFPAKWTGGATFTRYDTIAIGISPARLDWGKRAIAHELSHLIIHQMTFNPYNELPTWLDEGLAMYSEGALTTEFSKYLERAIAENSLISVRSLSSPFSINAAKASLSYAQSYSLVEFLIRHYGRDKMLGLLDTFSRGSSYDGALERVYGFDMDGLNTLWRDDVKQPSPKGSLEPVTQSGAGGGQW